MSLSNKYDSNIYVEPDGSSWVRVFHHNDPLTYGVFVHHSDAEWDAGVYATEEKWFDVSILNSITGVWELMVKQKTTSSATETKWRWTQPYNPLTTTAWATAQPGTVTYNTSSGYSSSSYGGLYKSGINARLTIANASSGNWYGAMGCWALQSYGIPGYPNTTVGTGYMDLYVRVDSLMKPISEKGLLLWLPLNGNLHNHGICQDLPVTNNGATISNTGKIGECYTFTNTTISVGPSQTFKSSFSAGASLAFWVKVSTSHNSYAQALVLGTVGTSWNDLKFGVDINANGNQIVAVSNGTNSTQCSSDVSIKDGVWHHVAATYKTGEIQVYLDGVLKKTAATSYVPAWNSLTTIGIGGNSSEVFKNGDAMNDVRVYNYALSAKEVKEISKALVLHYKLDDMIKKNLITNYDTSFNSIANGTIAIFNNQMNSGTQEVVASAGGVTKCLHLVSNGGNNRMYQTVSVSAGKSYTVSCDYYSAYAISMPFRGELNGGDYSWQGSNSGSYSTPNQWARVSFTFTNLTSNATLFYFMHCAQGTDCYIKNIKVEEGTSATPWVPADYPYDSMSFDSSGYQDIETNYATKYVMPGQNLPGNTSTAGRTQYYGDYGIIIPATENADTYFSVWYDTPLVADKLYTLSCNASGLLAGSYYTFPMFTQGNTSQGQLLINHNGRCFYSFFMDYTGTINTTTYNGQTLYRLFLDDVGRSLASGQGTITLTDFRLEEGWGPRIATKWAYDTTGDIEISSDTKRYGDSCFVNSQNVTTSTASGTVYLEAPCVLKTPDKISVAFWCKPLGGYGSSADQGQFCLTWNGEGTDYTASTMNHRDTTPDMNNPSNTQIRPICYFIKNEWHYYTFTYDGQTGRTYRDAVLQNTASFSEATVLSSCKKLILGFSKAGGVWRSNQSYFSDVRIYGTALSADDIKELYQTSASIDRDGNYYARELKE